jgi:tight adherence protein C
MLQNIKEWLPAVAGFLAFFGVLFFVIGMAIPARRNLLDIRLPDPRGPLPPIDAIEMQAPFTERFVRPLTAQLSRVVSRLMPNVALDNTQRQLLLAGLSQRMTVSDFIGLRGLSTLFGLSIGAGLAFFSGQPVFQFILVVFLFGGAGYIMPILWLRQQINRRRNDILRALPDAIDLLTISVEAGLGFDQAVARVVSKSQNSLTAEFARVLYEMQFGVARRDALRSMVERTGVEDLSNFVAAIIQAEQLGATLTTVLRIQSVEMRIRRRQNAERLAHLAPIKMLFPIAFLIFPPVFIVVLGPALPSLIRTFFPGFPL